MKPETRQKLMSAAALLAAVALTIAIIALRDEIGMLRNHVERYGIFAYPIIFILSIASSATIIIPLPGVLLTATWGTLFNPFLIAVITGSGAALGELSGYLAGYSGHTVIQKSRAYDRVVEWMKKYGEVTIAVLSFIPNPAFDLAGMVAGALKMPVARFLFFCWIGKVLKMLLFALTGYSLINLL